MDFDDIIRQVGQYGKYQKRLSSLLFLSVLVSSFNTMGIVFIGLTPDHWCGSPELHHLNLTTALMRNLTSPAVYTAGDVTYSSCTRYSYVNNASQWGLDDVIDVLASDRTNYSIEACPGGWHYDTTLFTSTIVTQFDMVCGRRWLSATGKSVYMFGFMVGSLLAGCLGDMWGRRPTFILCLTLTIGLGISVSFSTSYIMFTVLRFFIATFNKGIFPTGMVLAMEMIGPDERLHPGIIGHYLWAVGYMLFALLAYFMRDWFILNIVSSCVLLPLLVICFVTPESPRWLYTKGRRNEADAVMLKIANVNNKVLPDKFDVVVKSTKPAYMCDLFKTKLLAIRTIINCYVWMVCSMVFYGLSYGTSDLGGDPFINFTISAGVEIPAYIFTHLALHYWGRKLPMCGVLVGAGVAMLSTLAIPASMNWLSITLAMAGKLFISAAFAMVYVYTVEMYPTVVRGVALGVGSTTGRIGGIVAPYVSELKVLHRVAPLVLFGGVSLIAGILVSLFFPETRGKDLPETMDDADDFGKKKENTGEVDNVGFELDNI